MSPRALLATLALAALLTAASAAVSSASAAIGPRAVAIKSPAPRTVVPAGSGELRVRMRVGRRARKVGLFLDGRRRFVSRRRLVRSIRTRSIRTRRLEAGRHRLMLRVRRADGRVRKVRRAFVVKRPQSARSFGERPTASPAPAPSAAGDGPAWSDGFESGDFSAWSWWGEGQEDIWGHVSVVSAAAEGVPAREGSRVARFETTADDIANDRIHAKVFKSFSTGSGAQERPFDDQSGSYGVWYFFPTSYRVPVGTTVNALQFKDNYRTADGKQSDPLWWLNLGNAGFWSSRGGPQGLRSDAPVAYANNWGGSHWDRVKFVEVPLGRWVEFRAEVRHGERVDFYIDGKLFDTGQASEYPVNAFHESSINLIFGIGNYSGGANGPLYADSVSYNRLQ
ncbi:MAG: hypothetical protein WD399_06375 [Thermoleophilaceae bacterium]